MRLPLRGAREIVNRKVECAVGHPNRCEGTLRPDPLFHVSENIQYLQGFD
jgi:hypothetical protein